jgi:hypothetical protein
MRIAEHVEHARENSLADRRLQRPARVFHRHAARQALRGGQRDSAHAMRIELRQNLDGDAATSRWAFRVSTLPRSSRSRSAASTLMRTWIEAFCHPIHDAAAHRRRP